ncbi:MAG: TetR/AcrR family transcriptional regulator [Thiothrix sp.]|uniref:TetR/AcrR family transcriptional regulator n=1 Tax=Thiothrix sp. TaxID=1032 RepID=UPI00262E5852|nr:TetR/AcrR family transcriptional regulator [Thiothrix sp.]MDD5395580.1 TetR/AcrR family transcriptional regulator [Thiothrix sp.]
MAERKDTYHHPNLREALIQETEKMLAGCQLDSITLQELGLRLGVTRSAPYRHFASKNLLLCAVATRACGCFRGLLHAVRTQTGLPPEARLRQMVMTYFSFALENPDRYRLLFREPLVGENQTPELAESRARSFTELLLMLEECQSAGVTRQDDKERQALFVWSTMHGMSSLLVDKHLQLAEGEGNCLAFLCDSILRGLEVSTQPLGGIGG